MKILNVKNSWFATSGLRLDASYHLSEGPITKLKLKNSPYELTTLEAESQRIFSGNIFKRTYVLNIKNGWPYLTGSDMVKSDINSGRFISKKYTEKSNNLAIQKDWILISCSGTLGNTVFTNDDFVGKIGTHDLIRVIPNENKTKKGYLYAYLSSSYGKGLLTQSSYGGVVKHIEPHHIANLPIPILDDILQNTIHQLIIDSAKLQNDANKLFREADDLFHKFNNIKYDDNQINQSENAIQIGFVVKKSELFKKTIKARNHSLRARQIIELWNKQPGKLFKEYVSDDGLTRGMGGFFKRVSGANILGLDIISQGDIHERKPSFKKVIKTAVKDSEIAKRGMIILPSAGTLGENEIFLKPQLIYKNFEGKILSEVVGKIRPKSLIDAAYLFVALKSTGGFRVLRTLVYGTNLMYPNWELMKDINIPCISEEIKKIVADKIIEAYEKIAEASAKEKKALDIIEKEIESWQKY